MSRTAEPINDLLASRLRGRRPELEQEIMARSFAIADFNADAEPTYAQGLREAISAATDYALTTIEHNGREFASPPPVMLFQARSAVRNGTTLDTVLRRYFAGYTLFGDVVTEEAESLGILGDADFKALLRAQAALFDQVVTSIAGEYQREAERRSRSGEERRAAVVDELLSGGFADTDLIPYDFQATHLAAIAVGSGADDGLRNLAAALSARLLLVDRGEGTVWAWFGARDIASFADIEAATAQTWPGTIALALGEAATRLTGWRLSHRQASSAIPIALRGKPRVVRYADVALLASMIQDETLVTSLRQIYLDPLSRERDGGIVLRETFAAYFTARRNVSSAAAALGVTRQTVRRRLETLEERIGRTLDGCFADLDAALRLEAHLTEPFNFDTV